MRTLYIPVGISGSGKTVYGENINAIVICPDDIRKEKLGSINDQSNPDIVFSEYKRLLKSAASEGKDVYASMTHLKMDYIDNTVKAYSSGLDGQPFEVRIILFDDSLDPQLCYQRVKNDLKNSVDRANVPQRVILMQHAKYRALRAKLMETKDKNPFGKFGCTKFSLTIKCN